MDGGYLTNAQSRFCPFKQTQSTWLIPQWWQYAQSLGHHLGKTLNSLLTLRRRNREHAIVRGWMNWIGWSNESEKGEITHPVHSQAFIEVVGSVLAICSVCSPVLWATIALLILQFYNAFTIFSPTVMVILLLMLNMNEKVVQHCEVLPSLGGGAVFPLAACAFESS